MAASQRRSSTGVDRRASTRSSLHPQYPPSDSSDDDGDYDLAAMGVADGFRPAGAMADHNRVSSHASRTIIPGRRTPPPRPSSTTKPNYDSFALRNDGAMGPSAGRTSLAASTSSHAPTRSSSTSTDTPYMRAESPYTGPTGPSHPYQMYPQESRLARTASIATTSTIQAPDRPYNGPGGPTHPYGMYLQNTVPEGEIPSDASRAVPIGFHGLNSSYQRRLGPEGEEAADIIGPDGHTEQLPPYTRYPEEAFARKTLPTLAVPVIGAGGMGLATRNPEFASREDLSSPSRLSVRSFASEHSNHDPNTAAAATASEKPQLKKWQRAARRKLCGIVPVWVAVLVIMMLIIFAIILITVLAVVKGGKRGPESPPGGERPQSIVVTTMTTTFDATPLTASPTSLPALPTGTYGLPISAPSAVQNSCLFNTEQSAAWSCQIPLSPYTIVVTDIESEANTLANNQVSLGLGSNTFGQYYAYGTQPPVLNGSQVLNLVTDSQDPGRGPAWFFQLPYDKVVILPQAALAAPLDNVKRDFDGRDEGRIAHEFLRKNVAQPGDRPWFCFWNGTLLEGFIYPNLSSSAGQSAAASSLTSSGASATAGYGYGYGAAATSTSSYPTATSVDIRFPTNYPKVLKIEERRVPGPQAITPYCIQHELDNNGVAQVALNSTNQPIILQLNETESSTMSQMGIVKRQEAAMVGRDGLVDRQGQAPPASCGCVWLWT